MYDCSMVKTLVVHNEYIKDLFDKYLVISYYIHLVYNHERINRLHKLNLYIWDDGS